MMQKYPELKLEPTSIYSWKTNYKSNFWSLLIFSFFILFYLVGSIIGIIVSITLFGINDFFTTLTAVYL